MNAQSGVLHVVEDLGRPFGGTCDRCQALLQDGERVVGVALHAPEQRCGSARVTDAPDQVMLKGDVHPVVFVAVRTLGVALDVPRLEAVFDRALHGGIIPPMPDRELEAAWSEVHDATPTGWSVARPKRHDEERQRPWHVTAYDYRTAAKRHDVVEATDNTEAEALRDLAELLRGWSVERTEEPHF
jgi:hypothetical protein